jgi:hypothetical protein
MEQSKCAKLAQHIIDMATDDYLSGHPEWNAIVEEAKGAKEEAESLFENTYCLTPWPDSQDYMDEPWFDKEAILGEESSYFIPTKYAWAAEPKDQSLFDRENEFPVEDFEL